LDRWRKVVDEAKQSAEDMKKTTATTAKALADNWIAGSFGDEYSEK
jgi:hypothetical protein